MSNEDYRDYRGLCPTDRDFDILEIKYRNAIQLAQDFEKLSRRRGRQLAAREAATGPVASAMPAAAASGSGQLAQAPPLPGPSVRRSAGDAPNPSNTPAHRGRDEEQQQRSMRDQEPGLEISTHSQPRGRNGEQQRVSMRNRGPANHSGVERRAPISRVTRSASRYTPIRPGNSLANTTSPQNAAGAGDDGTSSIARALGLSALAPSQAHKFASPLAGNRFHSREARNILLQEAGAHPSMTVALGRFIAPDVTAESFRNAFGGGSNHERPQCKERNIVCINKEAQPYAPHSVDTNETFHLFLNMNPKLSRSTRQIRYLGTYTKVPIVHATVEPHEWQGLPSKTRHCWAHRICSSTRTGVREAHARISLRQQSRRGLQPSTDAIRQWIEQNSEKSQGLTQGEVAVAFRSGELKIEFEVIKYVRYDHDIAELLLQE